MTHKLLTIGDSLSQGFMSFASARTRYSYSTRIAKVLGLDTSGDAPEYRYPRWPAGGHPANLEKIFRSLDRFGRDVEGPVEWARALLGIRDILDKSEDYYERGKGAADVPYPGSPPHFHNLAYRGMDVAEFWKLSAKQCLRKIRREEDSHEDNFFGVASASFYRSALTMLNPGREKRRRRFAARDWVRSMAEEDGIENILLWLGSNNALGTVLSLKIRKTPNRTDDRPHERSHSERVEARWNLWHPEDFRLEYEAMIDRLDEALEDNRVGGAKVFVGNVPYVTIAPLAKGVGPKTKVDGYVYFKYYVHFPFEKNDISDDLPHWTLSDALLIDRTIAEYNTAIAAKLAAANEALGEERYHLVDVNDALTQLAWKRNGCRPTYELPDDLRFLNPVPNTKIHHADRSGRLRQGGIFSLDGVHPTVIGQGLIAREFLSVMSRAGVRTAGGDIVDERMLDWPRIVSEDSLYQKPVRGYSELRENKDLVAWVLDLLGIW